MNTKFRKEFKMIIAIILLILIFMFLTYSYIVTKIFDTTRILIKEKNVPESFKGFKIIHVSDTHNAQFGKNNKRLLKAIKDENPNIICITGDILDSYKPRIQIAINLLEGLSKIAPVYFVTGNHEYRLNKELEIINDKMDEFGIKKLYNKSEKIYLNDEYIDILGITDPTAENKTKDKNLDIMILNSKLEKLINEEEKKVFKMLLTHRPEFIENYAKWELDLVLAGHAHGGQVRIPKIGGILAPEQGFFPKYTEGNILKGRTNMVVSRGLGNSFIPFRVNNNPELVIITLDRG